MRAFSLLEMVLVLGVLGIVAALAAPRYTLALAEYRAEHAARRIAADIAATRDAARASAATQAIVFDLKTNAYQLSAAVAGNTPTRITLADEPFNARLISSDFAGQAALSFNGHGIASASGAIIVRSGGATRTILFDAATASTVIQ